MKPQSETLRLILTLVIISVISAGSLSIVYQITAPIIRQNQLSEMRDTLKEALPMATSFDEPGIPEEWKSQKEGVKNLFYGKDADGNLVGIAVVADAAGYQDYIQVLIAASPDMHDIYSVKILNQQETPGLGSRIEEPSFLDQFQGEFDCGCDDTISVGKYDAITGATVSSSTVIKMVRDALNSLYLKDNPDATTEASPQSSIISGANLGPEEIGEELDDDSELGEEDE